MNHEKRKTNSRDTESEEQHGETVPCSPAFLMNEGIDHFSLWTFKIHKEFETLFPYKLYG